MRIALFFFKLKDPQALARGILKLINNPPLRERYAKNAFNLVRNKFDSKIMLKKYEKLYTKVIQYKKR